MEKKIKRLSNREIKQSMKFNTRLGTINYIFGFILVALSIIHYFFGFLGLLNIAIAIWCFNDEDIGKIILEIRKNGKNQKKNKEL